jgi:hypothetical protein
MQFPDGEPVIGVILYRCRDAAQSGHNHYLQCNAHWGFGCMQWDRKLLILALALRVALRRERNARHRHLLIGALRVGPRCKTLSTLRNHLFMFPPQFFYCVTFLFFKHVAIKSQVEQPIHGIIWTHEIKELINGMRHFLVSWSEWMRKWFCLANKSIYTKNCWMKFLWLVSFQ